MATRVARKTTYIQQTTSEGETPRAGTSSPGRRTRSPSPARITRMEEKEKLQNLNDRLAAYIDKVRYLEDENARLSTQVRSTEETVTREVTNIKALYEQELEDVKKLLDETAKEKARLQLDANKYKIEAEDWAAKYHRRDRDAKNAEKKALELQAQMADQQAKLDDAENQRKHAEAEAARARAELAQLERQLATARKQLEDETLARVDLENRIQSLKEELSFKSQVYEQELNETRTRTTMEIEEVDSRIHQDYENKVQEMLQNLRAEHEEQLRLVREEVEILYEGKVNELQGSLDRSMSLGSTAKDELVITRRRVDELGSEVTKLKAQNAAYEARIRDLEGQLDSNQEMFENQITLKDQEIEELRKLLDEQTREYADLLDVKIRLDNEIEAYRRLLEGEEARLNLSQESTDSSTPKKGSARGLKRKRVTMSESVETFTEGKSGSDFASEAQASGTVEVYETDPEGKFIKLHNTGKEDVAIGGWLLVHTADSQETIYKFHHNLILRAGEYVTVWSSGVGETHNPPSNLVMKGEQKWFTGDHMKTILKQGDQEMASRTLTKFVRRSTQFRSRVRGGDEIDAGKRSECSVM
ncbi:hypothetical protein CHS0354_029318 [Potamilus streckersoni]|uniref:Lamin n=1 Tax=Potamilus streckersoni TaxID=2493646 RepID=A0AAE0T2W2_9BIVA|nr:hypothetical protein CHS0354_029318 [Potamilus streckersoni]